MSHKSSNSSYECLPRPSHSDRNSPTSAASFCWAKDNRFLVSEVEGQAAGGTGDFKADADCQLAVTTLEVAERARPEAVILVTGDGDFAPLAHALRRRGIHVAVASRAHMTATKLNHAANAFIDLEEEISSWPLLEETACELVVAGAGK